MTGFSFGFGGGALDIKPRVDFNAKSGRAYRIDRQEINGAWESKMVDITSNFAFLVNLESTLFGWKDFKARPIQELMVPFGPGSTPPPRPVGDFKPSVEVQIRLAKEAGGDLRQLSTSANCVIRAIEGLLGKIAQAPEHAQGKVAAVALGEVVPEKTKFGTNFIPSFVIQGWHERPAEFQDAAELARSNVGSVSGQGIGTPVSSGPAADDPADLPSEAGAEPVAAAPVAASSGALTF